MSPLGQGQRIEHRATGCKFYRPALP
jgi:hypothetical protein